MDKTKTIHFKYTDLPNPVRPDFLLEIKEKQIKRKELSAVLKNIFIDSKPAEEKYESED